MKGQVVLDIESKSKIDIGEAGSWRYSEDESTEIFCANFAHRAELDAPWEWGVWCPAPCSIGSPVQTDKHWLDKDPPPILRSLGDANGPELIAANVEFEAGMLINKLGLDISPDRCTCTHAMAAYFRLGSSLDKYAQNLGLGCKLAEGKHLIDKFSIPDAQGCFTECPPWMMDEFIRYCRHDVELTLGAFLLMRPHFPDHELEVFRWHMGVNMLGVPIDRDLLNKMRGMVCKLDTDVRLPKSFPKDQLTSVPFITAWLAERGVQVPNLRKETIEKILASKISAEIRSVMISRLAVSKASFDKLDSIDARLCRDSTIKGAHKFYGGHTGRWSSEGAQMQNFAKAPYGIKVRDCLDAVKANDFNKLSEITKGKPADGLVACMRPLIAAPPGYTFIMSDYGQIEARGAMWLAEDWQHVEMWRQNADMYCLMASKLFGRQITKADEKERDVGKRAVLSCCMQIGGNRFEEDAKEKYGLDLSLMNLTGDRVVGAFREEFPCLSAKPGGLWYRLQKAILRAAQGHEQVVNGILITRTAQGHIMSRLRSGRCLFFRNVQIVEDDFGPGVTYDSWNTKIKQYVREKLYGGSLTDIYVQATASDLLRNAALRMKADPDSPIIRAHVHDSITGMCRVEDVEKAKATLSKHMLFVPDWADRFPLKIDVGVCDRFMK